VSRGTIGKLAWISPRVNFRRTKEPRCKGTHSRSALPGTGNPVSDRAWIRWGVAAAVTGMLAWVVGVALIPLGAKLDKGNQHLAQGLRAHLAQGYAAALLAVLGAVLLAGFFAVLTRLVPQGHPGWGLLGVSLAGCVITQAMVAVGVSFALAAVHAAAGGADAGLVAFGWRGLWLTFLASAVPTILFTVIGVLGLRQARLSPPWGVRPGVAVGGGAPARGIHSRSAERVRARRDHCRARPAHHGHLDPRASRRAARVMASSHRFLINHGTGWRAGPVPSDVGSMRGLTSPALLVVHVSCAD
jgi:hypothetical protein